jgi:LPXTG-motif cell wall-anchored protein
VPIKRRIAALALAAALSTPAAALAQSPSDDPGSTKPPVDLSGNSTSAKTGSRSSELPNTGSDPRMLFLAGAAITLLGVGLRLRTADVDFY